MAQAVSLVENLQLGAKRYNTGETFDAALAPKEYFETYLEPTDPTGKKIPGRKWCRLATDDEVKAANAKDKAKG